MYHVVCKSFILVHRPPLELTNFGHPPLGPRLEFFYRYLFLKHPVLPRLSSDQDSTTPGKRGNHSRISYRMCLLGVA